MPTGTRPSIVEEANRQVDPVLDGDPRYAKRVRPHTLPRQINATWTSIDATDLLPGELVFNRNNQSLVYREDHETIIRFDNNATRAI